MSSPTKQKDRSVGAPQREALYDGDSDITPEPYGARSVFGDNSKDADGTEKVKDSGFHDRLRVNLSDIDVTANAPGISERLLDHSLLNTTKAGSPTRGDGFIEEDEMGEEGEDELEGADSQRYKRRQRNCFESLWYTAKKVFGVIVPYGGLVASSFNLASATLGAGIISLPSAFNLSGIIMSCIYLILASVGTVYSMNLLAKVMVKTGLRTFAQSARVLLGPGADYFLAVLIIIQCFGGSVAYIIATGSLLDPILKTPSSPEFLKTTSGKRLMTSMVWLVLMLPLVFPKRINSLRYASTIGVLLIIYFVFCMVGHSATHGMKNPAIRDELVLMRTGNSALEGLGVFLFSLMCQLNAFEVFYEAQHPTVFHFTLYSAVGIGTCALLYFLAGFFGYMDFGPAVKDSVLTLYDPVSEGYIAFGYIGIVIKICVAFALHMIPFRDALYHFLRWNPETTPYWKHCMVMAIPATAALLCGLFIPTINTVLGLLGSFCGGIIGMIMPALFYMYCGNFTIAEVGWLNYVATYLLLVGGVVAVVFGTTTTIYSTTQSSFS